MAAKADKDKGKRFTVASFNVNSVRSRLEVLVPWLRQQQPEVLCLQEIKVETALFPAAEFEQLGYRLAVLGQKGYAGVAIASRAPLADVAFGLADGQPSEEARLVRARVRGVNIVNTYVPQGREIASEHFQYKLQWLTRLRRFFEKHYTPRQKILWCGDINVAPAELDLHDPKGNLNHVCFTAEVRAAFSRVAEWGFIDVFRRHHPEPGLYSFFDYRVRDALKRGLGWRVDLIMATPPLAAKSIDCRIDTGPRTAARPSDHCPVVAEFEL
jgi:exodeoxyribonuclease-3